MKEAFLTIVLSAGLACCHNDSISRLADTGSENLNNLETTLSFGNSSLLDHPDYAEFIDMFRQKFLEPMNETLYRASIEDRTIQMQTVEECGEQNSTFDCLHAFLGLTETQIQANAAEATDLILSIREDYIHLSTSSFQVLFEEALSITFSTEFNEENHDVQSDENAFRNIDCYQRFQNDSNTAALVTAAELAACLIVAAVGTVGAGAVCAISVSIKGAIVANGIANAYCECLRGKGFQGDCPI